MKLVTIQFALTRTQLNALTAIKRGEVKGWGWPEDLCNETAGSLINLGVISHQGELTHAGELVISAAGLESVVNQ